ncbi:hypothetical protein EXS71_04975, partial [Candidatus Uhrbacteria bacterium]|nr:hypothetical protein [Candidatus Uhrbacteria bacterium]
MKHMPGDGGPSREIQGLEDDFARKAMGYRSTVFLLGEKWKMVARDGLLPPALETVPHPVRLAYMIEVGRIGSAFRKLAFSAAPSVQWVPYFLTELEAFKRRFPDHTHLTEPLMK